MRDLDKQTRRAFAETVAILGGGLLVGCGSEGTSIDGGARTDGGGRPGDAGPGRDLDAGTGVGDARSPGADSRPALPDAGLDPEDVRYVTTSGSDDADGRTEATAWRTIAHAARELTEGQVAFVKAGLYSGETIVFTNSGAPGRLIQLVGYRSVPGDAPALDSETYPIEMSEAVLPRIDGGDRAVGIGIYLDDCAYVAIRNLQVEHYEIGVYAEGVTHSVIDNVFVARVGDVDAEYSGTGITLNGGSDDNLVERCVVANPCAEGLMVYGARNLITRNRIYCDDNSTGVNSSNDYYLFSGGNENTFTFNVVHRIGDLVHGGHGIGCKGDTQGNVFEDNLAINFEGCAYYVRHRGSTNNTFRRNVARGGDGFGFCARDGAHDNLVVEHRVEDMAIGIGFFDTTEDENLQTAGDRNTFEDVVLEGIRGPAISFHDYVFPETTSTGNVFHRLTVNGAVTLFDVRHRSFGTELHGGTVIDVDNYATYEGGLGESDLDVTFDGTTFTDVGFTPP